MRVIKNLYDLKKLPPTNEVVYVLSVEKIFRNIDGEWIERAYYTTREVAQILGISVRRAQHIIFKVGLRPVAGPRNVNKVQLKTLVDVIKIRKANPTMKYSEIKKQLGV